MKKLILFTILLNGTNQGKGYSVKQVMLAAKSCYVLFGDADRSTLIKECDRYLKYLQEGYNGVIASRGLPESRSEIRQNPMWGLMVGVFNKVEQCFSFKRICDSQRGFKGFSQKTARDLFARQQLKGFSFDAKILFLAQNLGYRILETCVVWRNYAESQVRILSDLFDMFFDRLRICWLHHDL